MEDFFLGKEALFAWRFGFNSWHTGLSLQRLRFNTFTLFYDYPRDHSKNNGHRPD